MTKNQAEWAKDHDWFKYSFEETDGTWSVVVNDPIEGDEHNRQCFSDFKSLYHWAGY